MNSNILRALVILMLAVTSGVAIAQDEDTNPLSLNTAAPDCLNTEALDPAQAKWVKDLYVDRATLRLDLTYESIRLMADMHTPAELVQAYISIRQAHTDLLPYALPCRQSYLLQLASERLLNDFFYFWLLAVEGYKNEASQLNDLIIHNALVIQEVAPFYTGDTTLVPEKVLKGGR